MTEQFELEFEGDTHDKCSFVGTINHDNCLSVKSIIYQCLFAEPVSEECISIDCTHLTEIDGSGLGVIVNLYIALKCQHKILYLHNIQGQPKQLMEYLNINQFFEETEECQSQSALQNA